MTLLRRTRRKMRLTRRRLRRHRGVTAALLRLRIVKVLDRDGLRRRAAASGSDRQFVLADSPAGVGPRLLAGPIQPLPSAVERAGRRVTSPPPWSLEPGFVAELDDATLVGRKPLVFTAEGELVLDSLTATRADNERLEHTLRGLIGSHGLRRTASGFTGRHRVEGPDLGLVCLLSGGLQRSYYHWTLEQLLKLRAVDEYRRRTGETPRLVLPRGRNPWMRELLELVGYGDAEILHWWRRGARAARLVLPSHPQPTPSACRWLRERVLGGSAATSTDQGRERVLVVRDEGRRWWKRAVVNQGELERGLEPLGFRPYRLAAMAVAEQAQLFARAEAVVAPHGAGLTNLVFSTGAAVVELFGRDVRPHYFRLAQVLGLDYRYLLCEPATVAGLRSSARRAEPEQGPQRPPRAGIVDESKLPGVHVDVAELRRVLAAAGVT